MGTNFTATDLQKVKLEKLMQNIDKPIEIPQRPKESKFAEAPDFIRNIMGSSAGAGSGEFHVYRHLRRKEYARQRFIEEQAKKEELDRKFREKLEENMRKAEERTAKKRAKRLKKKQKLKKLKRMKKSKNSSQINSTNDEESESESEEDADEPDVKSEGESIGPSKSIDGDESQSRDAKVCGDDDSDEEIIGPRPPGLEEEIKRKAKDEPVVKTVSKDEATCNVKSINDDDNDNQRVDSNQQEKSDRVNELGRKCSQDNLSGIQSEGLL